MLYEKDSLKNYIEFDLDFYRKNNNDLRSLSNNELKRHFIEYGYKEKRIFCKVCEHFDINYYLDNNPDIKLNKNNITLAWQHYLYHGYFEGKTYNKNHVNNYLNLDLLKKFNLDFKHDSLNSNISFDLSFYKLYNKDLTNFTNKELIEHFINNGLNEKRLYCDIPKNFDIDYYLDNNPDIKISKDNKFLAWQHYLYHGYYEGKTYNVSHKNNYLKHNKINKIDKVDKVNKVNKVNNVNKNKYGIIYVYYNRPGEYKNELNMAFFIDQTIKKRNLEKDSTEFLFIINNNFTEIEIPQINNVTVLKNNNCMDFEAYLTGINFYEKKYSKKINKIFSHVLFINCSCTGPFIKDNSFWLQPFIDRFKDKKVATVTTILTSLKNLGNLSGAKTPGYFNFIKSDCIDLLIKPNNLFNNVNYSNTVFGRKKNKMDCILSGEHALSSVLIKNGHNIAGIVNKKLDYRYQNNINTLNFSGDRYPIFNYNIYNSIFVKNHWRIDNSARDSFPVKWTETKNEIEKLSNLKFIDYPNNCFDYNLLNINSTGDIIYNKTTWKSKIDFGSKFSDSELLVCFPISNCLTEVNYVLHDSNYVKNYVIESLKALLYINCRINFYTNLTKPFNFSIPNSIKVINNLDINNKNLLTFNSNQYFPCSDIQTFKYCFNNKDFEKTIVNKEDVQKNLLNPYLRSFLFYNNL